MLYISCSGLLICVMNDHEMFDFRSIKLKKAVGPQKKEVLVQTGAGFFRFEGNIFQNS